MAVLDISESTAESYAVILSVVPSQGAPSPANVVWIAASAMEHGLCVLTRDAHCLLSLAKYGD